MKRPSRNSALRKIFSASWSKQRMWSVSSSSPISRSYRKTGLARVAGFQLPSGSWTLGPCHWVMSSSPWEKKHRLPSSPSAAVRFHGPEPLCLPRAASSSPQPEAASASSPRPWHPGWPAPPLSRTHEVYQTPGGFALPARQPPPTAESRRKPQRIRLGGNLSHHPGQCLSEISKETKCRPQMDKIQMWLS